MADPIPDASAVPPVKPVFAGYSLLASTVWFWGCAGILLGAVLLSVSDGRQVLLPWIQRPLPETCGMRLQLGIDCPGCGLTRSFIYLAQGNISAAWRLNFMSLPIFLYVVAQLPLALAHWCRFQSGWVATATWLNERAIIALALLLFARWSWLLITGQLWA